MKRAAFIGSLILSGIMGWRAPAFGAAGASGGLTLIEAAGARAAAVGEAFSAAQDDVTAMTYNPAALATLSSRQVSFSYHSGIADDAAGRIDAGMKNFGVSAAYYTAGSVDLLESGVNRSVNAQTDLAVSVGSAFRLGRMALGLAGKYISSRLIETDRATAWAGDAGFQLPVSGVRVSGAIQNIGSRLTYVEEGDRLPRIARAGLEIPIRLGRVPVTVRGEAPYFLNEQEWRPAAGLEIRAGPLSFRAGYRSKAELEGLTLGTGFALGAMTLDYAFGFVDNLSARQRVSIVLRFDGPSLEESPIDRKLKERNTRRNKPETQAPGPWRHRMGDME